MTRRYRGMGRTVATSERTRRQFLSTLVVGAAYTACGDPADNAAGGRETGIPNQSGPRGDASTPDARSSSGGSGGSSGSAEAGSPPSETGGAQADATVPPEPQQDAGTTPTFKGAAERVMLGATGLVVSRLAMGSGTHGSNGTSEQTKLGVDGFANLLVRSYHEQGINFWETADQYGSHPHLKEAIRQVGRDKVVVLTKASTETRTSAQMQAALDRFLLELGVDYIDVVLLHAVTSANWTTEAAGAMEYLTRAKEKGLIRAHGTSCHSLAASRLAAKTPWVEVNFGRINPASIAMDSDPDTVIKVLRDMKTAGKGVVGMKILGIGELATQMDMAIRHAVQLDAIDAFTIGFTSYEQLDQVATKIAEVSA
jgi:predicted oxidoreductase